MTDFLQKTGTNGFLATPFNLMTTELNTLANGNSAVSSVGGSSGVFSQSDWQSGLWAEAHFVAGGAVTPSAGGYIAGWFLLSPDGGSTFEKTFSNTDLPRTPDLIIPFANSALASNDVVPAMGIIRLPWWSTKLFVVSHVGVSLPSSGNIIKLGSVAVSAV